MYRPFINTCRCGGTMHPAVEPHTDNTHPSLRHKEVSIVFLCNQCAHAEVFTYKLPTLRDDVSKNLIYYVCKYLRTKSSLLLDPITLESSNLYPVTEIDQKGLAWALADLQQKNVLYDVTAESFRLTLLGWLLVWHGPY